MCTDYNNLCSKHKKAVKVLKTSHDPRKLVSACKKFSRLEVHEGSRHTVIENQYGMTTCPRPPKEVKRGTKRSFLKAIWHMLGWRGIAGFVLVVASLYGFTVLGM